ncbi:MAG: hypothetical protein K6D96_03160 [Acetatifactor sp.]|nr:hypothetical protein [Acetatifactor sp.]
MKRKVFMFLILIFSLIMLLGVTVFAKQLLIENSDPVVMYVGESPVSEELFRILMNREKAKVSALLPAKKESSSSNGYWDEDHDGITPRKLLMEKTAEKAKYVAAVYREAATLGLTEYFDSARFDKALENENKRRKEAIESGEIIYGVPEYDKDTYFTYIFSNLEIRLKEKLFPQDTITEEELRSLYKEKQACGLEKSFEDSRKGLVAEVSEKLFKEYMAEKCAEAEIRFVRDCWEIEIE